MIGQFLLELGRGAAGIICGQPDEGLDDRTAFPVRLADNRRLGDGWMGD